MWTRVRVVQVGGVESVRNMKEQGVNIRKKATDLGISRNTVSKKLKTTKSADFGRGKVGVTEMCQAILDKMRN